MKARVFKTAWQISARFSTFAKALKHAWALIKLKRSMLLGVTKFTYKRIDGSMRSAIGTLKDIDTRYTFQCNARAKESIVYFDLEMGAFRCFKIDNLIY